jgi:nondiscriminating aspartyl-tRNA synthetase
MKELELVPSVSSLVEFSEMGKELCLTGQIQNIQVLAWGGFIQLRLPNYLVQCVVDGKTYAGPFRELVPETAVRVRGVLAAASVKNKNLWPRHCEIQVREITVLSVPGAGELPVDVSKKELNCDLSTNFDHRPLTLRHPRARAVFRIASVICGEFGNFLDGAGFTRICSPKIVREGAEGGANLFKLNYFDRDAYLAQSPQFYKQMMVGVFGRVYEEAPVFRAEEHNTSRHLNEYLSLDLEMILENGFEDIIQTEAAMLRSVFARLGERCGPELEALGAKLPALDRIITLKFREVHEIVLAETGRDCRAEADLDPEEERVISEYAKKHWESDFVFVTHYPSSKRPFYALDDPENPGETLSFDLIFRGVEITTGGARMYRYEDYLDKMRRRNMNPAAFESYLQTFKFGIPPHGGLGLGLERLTAQLCGLANVKEASLFPRDRHRLEP